ncbi:MAG: hypothetical protein JO267_13250 [Alphaproteobacteria bacterium]|nr:hypothetical protein [Alphaproteobacteria bacterium]
MVSQALRHRETLDKIIAEERAEWHFNPLLKTQDYRAIGNIKSSQGSHWDEIVCFAQELDRRIEMSSAFDWLPSPDEHDKALIRSMGYDKYSTSLFRIYSDSYPEIFDPILTACDLIDPIGSLIHQKPGGTCPWHYDTFAFYKQRFAVSDPSSISRYLIFLEDWIWGHYVLVGNSVVHQWHAGDVISWPWRMRHLSANAGLTPKLTIQVTGKRPPARTAAL